jgi:hypothetical protein
MANHLTLDELAAQHDLDRQAVVEHCFRTGVPILNGRVDKSLFAASYATDREQREDAPPPRML